MRDPLIATGNAAALAPIHRGLSERVASSGMRAEFVPNWSCRRADERDQVGTMLYVMGDTNDLALGLVKCFDPATGAWEAVAPMASAREDFGAAMVGGKVYMMGGKDGNGGMLGSVECFDQATGAWEVVASMVSARDGCSAAIVGGKAYVMGGKDGNDLALSSVERFDPVTGAWEVGTTIWMGIGREGLSGVSAWATSVKHGGRTVVS